MRPGVLGIRADHQDLRLDRMRRTIPTALRRCTIRVAPKATMTPNSLTSVFVACVVQIASVNPNTPTVRGRSMTAMGAYPSG